MMYNPYEIETNARLRREEIAQQFAAIRLAEAAERGNPTNRAWRRRLATALRATASRLAPTAAEPLAEAESLTA